MTRSPFGAVTAALNYFCVPFVAFGLVVCGGCRVIAHGPQVQTIVPNATAELPAWLTGVWTRDWIRRKGVQSNLFAVHYLQTPTFFGDVRFPINRPTFSHAASFADLTDEELRLLAHQRGFTGRTTAAGAIATWHHEIDFQPPDGTDDIGRLERIDDTHMYEHAIDSSYVEAWRSVGGSEGRFLVVRVERAGRLDRMLIVVGEHFLYVRNRAKDLPIAESLDSLIAATRASRAQIIEYLDCEFSAGHVGDGSVPWEIQHSTLPWREGRHLEFVDGITTAIGAERLIFPVASGERWSVPVNTLAGATLASLFPSPK